MRDPADHEAHSVSLEIRLLEMLIGQWLNTATAIALAGNGNPPLDDYERGIKQGVEQMRYTHLADYSYTVVPRIIDEFRRAGIMKEENKC